MSLPLQAIERLFLRLGATYGRDFTGKYEGTDANAVKSSWAHELDRTPLPSIAYALDNLPPRCPNVIEFRALCRFAPSEDVPALPEPKADPERVRQELAKLGHVRLEPAVKVDRLDWARAILKNPNGRTPTVLAMARGALESERA